MPSSAAIFLHLEDYGPYETWEAQYTLRTMMYSQIRTHFDHHTSSMCLLII